MGGIDFLPFVRDKKALTKQERKQLEAELAALSTKPAE